MFLLWACLQLPHCNLMAQASVAGPNTQAFEKFVTISETGWKQRCPSSFSLQSWVIPVIQWWIANQFKLPRIIVSGILQTLHPFLWLKTPFWQFEVWSAMFTRRKKQLHFSLCSNITASFGGSKYIKMLKFPGPLVTLVLRFWPSSCCRWETAPQALHNGRTADPTARRLACRNGGCEGTLAEWCLNVLNAKHGLNIWIIHDYTSRHRVILRRALEFMK
jgi:hypothetical protein